METLSEYLDEGDIEKLNTKTRLRYKLPSLFSKEFIKESMLKVINDSKYLDVLESNTIKINSGRIEVVASVNKELVTKDYNKEIGEDAIIDILFKAFDKLTPIFKKKFNEFKEDILSYNFDELDSSFNLESLKSLEEDLAGVDDTLTGLFSYTLNETPEGKIHVSVRYIL